RDLHVRPTGGRSRRASTTPRVRDDRGVGPFNGWVRRVAVRASTPVRLRTVGAGWCDAVRSRPTDGSSRGAGARAGANAQGGGRVRIAGRRDGRRRADARTRFERPRGSHPVRCRPRTFPRGTGPHVCRAGTVSAHVTPSPTSERAREAFFRRFAWDGGHADLW